jgi:competence protein ComEC
VRSPAAVPVLALVAGVAAGIESPLSPAASPIVAFASLTAVAVAVCSRSRFVRRSVIAAGLGLAGLSHGTTARDHALHSAVRAVLDAHVGGAVIDRIGVLAQHGPIAIRALLLEDAAGAGEFVSLRVRAEAVRVDGTWTPVNGGLVISVNGAVERSRAAEWRAGRTITVPVTFRRPSRYLDDGVADFERDAALNGITLLGSAKSALLVDVVRRGTRLDEWAADARAFVRASIGRWVRPHGDLPASIVTAVLIGDRTGLPDDVRVRLQAAGTYHVIAISGGNIAILAAIVLAVFAVFGVPGRLAAAAAIVLLVAYAAVVAAGPSVWRATLMAVLYFGARVFDHRASPSHALLLAAGIIALVHPLDVRDAGFLLTFGATAGLLGAGRMAEKWLPRGRVLAWVTAPVIASIAAETVLLPVSATVFSRVTFAGLLLNLIAIPAMALVQVAGMVAVALDRAPAIASAAGRLAAGGASVLVSSGDFVDMVPALVHRVPAPPPWIVVAYYLALLVAWRGSPRRRLVAQVAVACAGVLIVTGRDPLTPSSRRDVLRLTTLDVGQGESLLLEPPGADPILIDTGGSPFGGGAFDIGGRVVAPALWARHVRRLGTLLVTHGDPDHLGGARAVLSDFRPRSVWWGTPVPRHEPSLGFVTSAAGQGSVVAFRRAGDEVVLGGVRLRILHPPPPEWERQKVRNDDSVVVEVVYGNVAVLLTGDITAAVERAIVPDLTPAPVRVLKVAHHGSRTSSSRQLLEGWHPQIALISCGRGNTFGHPAPEVLERLASIGARVYRTDRDGELTVESDGKRVSVRTFAGGEP